MLAKSSPAQSAASRDAGLHHGPSGRTFFLLADEDPEEFAAHEALWLAEWCPRGRHEHRAAGAAIRAMWREERADRLEAVVLGDLFAAGRLPDPAEAEAAKVVAFKALNTLLRYRARIEREHRAARRALEALRQRRPAPAATPRPSEPEPAPRPAIRALATPTAGAASPPRAAAAQPSEPEQPPRPLNRHQRRALAAMARRAA